MTPQIPTDRPEAKVVGEDGNAFMILGRCMKAARRAGWTAAQIKAVTAEMKAGDYDHLLATAEKYFELV